MDQQNLFQKRRDQLRQSYSRTLFVIPSGLQVKRSHSVQYRFKPAADFFYLCGLHLSSAILLICKSKTYLLFDQPEDQIWGEHTVLTEQDRQQSQDLQFESLNRLQEILHSHSSEFDRIAFSFDRDLKVEKTLLEMISFDRTRSRSGGFGTLCDSRLLVGTLRMVKSAEEVALLKEAGQRTSQVHHELMQQSLAGRSERQVANWIEGGFLRQDLQWTAYETIVGSGIRSTTLHARASDRVIQKNDLVLVDAGGEWQGYCADITRVLPAEVRFSQEQKEIYQVVLAAQKQAIALVKPGATLQEIHHSAIEVLIEQLAQLNFSAELVRNNIKKLMPHFTSHWIGLDVHDPSPYVDDNGAFLRLSAGMCLTIEPGLYFRSENESFRRYEGIGVRIEDDVVVTDKACELLSSVPKEVEEVEGLRALQFESKSSKADSILSN